MEHTISETALYLDAEEQTLAEFLVQFKKALDKIPIEHREQAVVKLGGDYSSLQIEWQRPQTPEEIAESTEREARHKQASEDRELRQFLMLKKKYEGI